MSYEPKYKLNRVDDARWIVLLTRHCLECAVKAGKASKKYHPLSTAENAEFEALCIKRSRKIASHPKVAASIRASQRHNRRANRLLQSINQWLARVTG